jgi:hypothetical protein
LGGEARGVEWFYNYVAHPREPESCTASKKITTLLIDPEGSGVVLIQKKTFMRDFRE